LGFGHWDFTLILISDFKRGLMRMSILVRIPSPLQGLTKGEKEVEVTGATLAEVIADLEKKYPGFRERLLDEKGELRRFVNVYVNEEDVRFLEGLATKLEDGAEVSIIPAVAGGTIVEVQTHSSR